MTNRRIKEMQAQLSEISFTIINNTASNVPMNFMGNLANTADISNQYTQYKWDVTTVNFNYYDTVSIQLRGANSGLAYTTLTAPYETKTIQGVLDALNALNVACFFTTSSGGSTYIETYNDNTEFANLSFDNTSYLWYIGYRGTYAGTGGSWNIQNPAPTVIYNGTFPVIQSPYADISSVLTYASNQLTWSLVAGTLPILMEIFALDLSTNVETSLGSVSALAGNPASIGPISASNGNVYIVDFS
jgi:hypothetical protein